MFIYNIGQSQIVVSSVYLTKETGSESNQKGSESNNSHILLISYLYTFYITLKRCNLKNTW